MSQSSCKKYRRLSAIGFTLLGSAFWGAASLRAVSPETLSLGRQLFEKNWSHQSPALTGKDGLGPLFNGRSCVACHNQGGIGGSGAAEFNAKTVSIERMEIAGSPITIDAVRQAAAGFHPGFVDPRAGVVNSLTLHHHGGTSQFDASRKQFMSSVPALFSDNGGAVSAEEVRLATATPIIYSKKQGGYQVTINARLFQRNTTPLFGLGVLDRVSSKELRAIEKEQKSHPEISGRVSTLANGRMGRFGWRANVPTLLDFCDQACAAEVGLKTRRIDQPGDPMAPAYRNPSTDISDSQIRAMADFVAALPMPTREIPSDPEERQMVVEGERLFASVGCAVCHRPQLGGASGVYGDMLLHDMGPKNYDLNPADPYVTRVTPAKYTTHFYEETQTTTTTMVDDTVMGVAYYGGNYMMEPGESSTMVRKNDTPGRSLAMQRGKRTRRLPSGVLTPTGTLGVMTSRNRYLFQAPRAFPETTRIIGKSDERKSWTDEKSEEKLVERKVNRANRERLASGRDSYTVNQRDNETKTLHQRTQRYLRVHLDSTQFAQEWKTPPLWGVRDSAPYMHDGRAETLLEAITMHEGESEGTRDRFLKLSVEQRRAVIAFLNTLVAPRNVPQRSDSMVSQAR